MEHAIFEYLFIVTQFVDISVSLFQLSFFISHTRQTDMIVPRLLDSKGIYSRPRAFQLQFECLRNVTF